MDTSKLLQFADFLRNEANKITDALFVENLIKEIGKQGNVTIGDVDCWLISAFNFPSDCDKDNCFDTYNRSFYRQIISKL